MYSGFSFERGKYLFEEEETDFVSVGARSKSAEHSAFERSKSDFSDKIEISQKSEKIEENES